ncbi:MAG: hypothetical protein EOM54_08155 [Clostridia bacterium]|nr:hypothetical protein [Clostridia bacterium]
MRRRIFAALMILPLLLFGCAGSGEEKRFESFREDLAAASEIRMEAEVTADYDDSVREYTLSFCRTSERSEVEVLQPELIAGVKAHIDEDGSDLEYDGLILDTGKLAGDGLTPVSALPRLLDAMQKGHVDSIWKEGDCIAAELTPDDVISVTLWIDAETLAPRRAELSGRDSGRVLISCEIKTFEYIS